TKRWLPILDTRIPHVSNPHPPRSLAWASWIIARLGGWDGYPRTKPGPITMRHGVEYFLGVASAWKTLQSV
ncbi:MAG TPA: IS4 family transposase, partial [Bradyrhizobium sp.]|nr:IS4 family transposase [Bradyrhizobium sp.]